MTTPEEVHELHKQYSGTYIARRVGAVLVPVFVEEINLSETGELLISGKNIIPLSKRVDLPPMLSGKFQQNFDLDTFCLDYPKVGAFPIGAECAGYLRRIPTRQWKRGVAADHQIIYNYSEKELAFLKKACLYKGIEEKSVLYSWFNPVYLQPLVCYDLIMSGKALSLAISSRFVIATKMEHSNPVLFYKTHIVGEIKGKEAHLHSSVKHLIEELSEYLPCKLI